MYKAGNLELYAENWDQYYAPARTIASADHGEQEEQINFALLEILGVPNTPAARRQVARIFSGEDFTINDTEKAEMLAYYITGEAARITLPSLSDICETILNGMK